MYLVYFAFVLRVMHCSEAMAFEAYNYQVCYVKDEKRMILRDACGPPHSNFIYINNCHNNVLSIRKIRFHAVIADTHLPCVCICYDDHIRKIIKP